MSGLEDLLSGALPPAVYRWSDDGATQQLGAACAAAGWDLAEVDGRARPDRVGLLRELGRVLDFPAYYGQNFDALADCLHDLDRPTLLVWDGWGELARDEPQTYVMAVDVLGSRAEQEPSFAVLLRGAGPEVDPPWIGA